jgi:hypothetical protein
VLHRMIVGLKYIYIYNSCVPFLFVVKITDTISCHILFVNTDFNTNIHNTNIHNTNIHNTNIRNTNIHNTNYTRGRRGRDCMIVGFTTTYTISAYHH